MGKRQKQLVIVLGIFLISMIIVNRSIRSSLQPILSSGVKDKVSSVKESDSKPAEVFVEERSKYHLTPDNPAQYNIKVQDRYDIPLTEQQWEYKMRQSLRPSSQRAPAVQESLAGIEKNPAEIENRIAEITTQIKEYEAIALNNPADRKAQEKLQNLYMLKATLKVLKDKVTSQPVIAHDKEDYEK